MRKVVVAGIGQTAFGKFKDRSVRSLAEEALQQALKDAGFDAPRIGVVYFANALSGLITGQETIRGQVALRYTPLMGTPIVNIDNACASGSSAFNLAWLSVASGQVDVALAIGAEKLTHEDKAVTFGAFASGVDVEERHRLMRETPGNHSLFMDIYASRTRKYMAASGATAADFAAVCMKSRRAASFSRWAQFKDELSESDVLNARVISHTADVLADRGRSRSGNCGQRKRGKTAGLRECRGSGVEDRFGQPGWDRPGRRRPRRAAGL